jgi:NTP pyrophosphatase (non-canonical NTP hydrolase)
MDYDQEIFERHAENHRRMQQEKEAMAGITDNLSFIELRLGNMVRHREWNPDDSITLSFRGNELAGEVGEACNIIKKMERKRLGLAGTHATAQQLAEELADVIISADLIAMTAGIDLAAAVRDKFNATNKKFGLTTQIV